MRRTRQGLSFDIQVLEIAAELEIPRIFFRMSSIKASTQNDLGFMTKSSSQFCTFGLIFPMPIRKPDTFQLVRILLLIVARFFVLCTLVPSVQVFIEQLQRRRFVALVSHRERNCWSLRLGSATSTSVVEGSQLTYPRLNCVVPEAGPALQLLTKQILGTAAEVPKLKRYAAFGLR